MLRRAADENFNADIVRVARTWVSLAPMIRPSSGGLTHDISTLVGHAFARVGARQPMPGVCAVRARDPIGSTIEDLVLLAECSLEGEWEGQVRFLPL